jgi:hypothetical protein
MFLKTRTACVDMNEICKQLLSFTAYYSENFLGTYSRIIAIHKDPIYVI